VAGVTIALLNNRPFRAELPSGLPRLHWQVYLDDLASFLFCITGTVVLAISLYATGCPPPLDLMKGILLVLSQA
jgi:hypothetical protein